MTPRSQWVVVIDDDEAIRDAVSELLVDEGYRVDTFTTAEEALQALANGPVPDLILLDYLVPHMGAERFVQELDALGIGAPLLLVTAANRASLSSELLRLVGVVQKPFAIGSFLDRVAEASGRNDDPGNGEGDA